MRPPFGEARRAWPAGPRAEGPPLSVSVGLLDFGEEATERRGRADGTGEGEHCEGPEGEGEGDEEGHCKNECRGLGHSVKAIDDLFSFIFLRVLWIPNSTCLCLGRSARGP